MTLSSRETHPDAERTQGLVTPRADWGFFGPDSVAYRVWLYPTSTVLGFMRAVSVEFLDPHLSAAVQQTGQVMRHTRLRYDRTMQYFAAVLYADAETVLRYSDQLVRIHARSHGTDPVTGTRFDANDPESQLWIHVTAWHSILKCYEEFGPGRLSPQDETRYWADCAKAAELQTIDPDTVPRSREAVRTYFAERRARNAASEHAQAHYRFLVHGARGITRDLPNRAGRIAGRLLDTVTWRAIASTLPRWANDLGGIRYGPGDRLLLTVFGRPAIRFTHRYLHEHPALASRVLAGLAPLCHQVLEPVLLRRPPVREKVWSIAEAREQFAADQEPQLAHAPSRR